MADVYKPEKMKQTYSTMRDTKPNPSSSFKLLCKPITAKKAPKFMKYETDIPSTFLHAFTLGEHLKHGQTVHSFCKQDDGL
jgi:hypothetical protein